MGCSTAEAITLGEAIALWLACEQPISSRTLWGMSIRRWGHIGKIITFVSAAFVIAEIIGYQRLAAIGESLAMKNGPVRALNNFRILWITGGLFSLYLSSYLFSFASSEWDFAVEDNIQYLNPGLYLIIGTFWLVGGILTGSGIIFIVYGSFAGLITLTMWVIGLLFRNPKLKILFQMTAFCLLSTGVFLDLLAS